MPDWTELNAYGDKRHDDKSLIAVWAYFCHRCGYIWLPKDFDIYDDDTLDRRPPKSCARCKSKYYDMIPRDEHRPEQPFYVGIRQDMRRRKEKATANTA